MSDEKATPMTNQETMTIDDSEMGDIRIHESVIASLSRRAVLAVPGVSRLAGNSLVNNIAEIVGSSRMQSRNISIILGDENNVAIEIKIVMTFGFCIPDVAAKIQKAVIEEVEKTTGMNVTSVNVLVQDIEDISEKTPDNDSNNEKNSSGN